MAYNLRVVGALGLALAVMMPVSGAIAATDDAALFEACPGLSGWAARHPHGRRDVNSGDGAWTSSVPDGTSAELARRAALDQQVRAPLSGGQTPSPAELRRLAEVDADNLRWLKEQIRRHGFPSAEQVGEQGELDAWLLVQHADADPRFQQSVLASLMARQASSGIRKADMAMLSDRVLLAQGKPQKYGTQFVRNGSGEFVLQEPVEDLGGIDARRARMDLMPLGLYRCVLHATYDPPAG